MNEELKINTSNWVICTDNPISLFEPNYTVYFCNKEHKEVGNFDFNGDKLKFEGDVEESTQVFINFLLSAFNQRIEEIKSEAIKEYKEQFDPRED